MKRKAFKGLQEECKKKFENEWLSLSNEWAKCKLEDRRTKRMIDRFSLTLMALVLIIVAVIGGLTLTYSYVAHSSSSNRHNQRDVREKAMNESIINLNYSPNRHGKPRT